MEQKCKTAVEAVLERQLSDKEVELLEKEFKKASRELPQEDIKAWKSMSDEERVEAIADRALSNYTEQHIKDVQTLVNDVEIREQLIHELENNDKLNSLEVLARKLAMHTDNYGVQSVEHNIKRVESLYFGKLGDVLAETQQYLGFMVNKNKVRTIAKQMFGENTGDAEVAKLAKQLADVFEEIRVHYNRYGGNIGKLKNYGLPQSHSHYKVIKKTANEWVDFVFPLIDRGKYRHEETGLLMSPTEVKDVLRSIYTTIASEGFNKDYMKNKHIRSDTESPLGINLQNLHTEHRELHFKDADSWLNYQDTFGEINFLDLVSNHVRVMSNQIGLMQAFGSNPERMVKQINQDAYAKLMSDPNFFDKHKKLKWQNYKNEKLYNTLAGRSLNIDSTLSNVGAGIRALNVSAKLGSAAFYAVSDVATIKLTAEMNNLAVMDIIKSDLKNIFSKKERDFAIKAGLGVQEMVSALGRFGEDDLASASTRSQNFKKNSQKLANITIRMSALNHLTASAKRGFGSGLMSHISDINTKTNWSDLHAKDVEALTTGGLNESDWGLLKLVDRTEAPNGAKLITNEKIYNLSDDTILNYHNFNRTDFTPGQLADEAFKLKEILANKYYNHIYAQTDSAIVGVGVREQLAIDSTAARGSAVGELSKFAWQYKQFFVGTIMRHVFRGLSQSTLGGKVAYLAKFIAYTSVAGGIIAQLQQLSQGKDLLDMTDPSFYLTSLVKGGGLPFLGDALNGSFGSERTLVDFFMPASFKDPIDILTWGTTQGKKALEGEDVKLANAALDKVQKNIPMQNIWYARTAIDRLIFAELHNMIDPDFRYNRQRRIESMGTSSFYWDLDNESIRMPEMTDSD